MVNPLLKAAREALERGWYVFGTVPRTKKPFPQTHGFKDALNDDRALLRWKTDPEANPCVWLEKSGLVVLDADHGLSSLAHAEAWAEANGLPETYIVQSGREGGGFHFYFKGTRSLPDVNRNSSQGRVGFELDGVSGDIKCHGYTVLSGGIHPKTDSTYRDNGKAIAFLPEFIRDYRDPKDVRESERQRQRVAKWAETYPDSDPNILLKEGDGRHTQLLRDAGRLRQLGLEEEAIYLGLKNIAARFFEDGESYSDAEIRRLAFDMAAKPCTRVLKRKVGRLIVEVKYTQPQMIDQFLKREFPVGSAPMSIHDIVARINTEFPDISGRTARRAIKKAKFIKVGVNPVDERVPLWARRGDRKALPS